MFGYSAGFRACALLFAVVVVAAPAGAGTGVGVPVRVSPTTCNPSDSSTWALGGQGRLYELPGAIQVRANGTRFQDPPAIYGCLFAFGRPWRLNLPQSGQPPWNASFNSSRWKERPGLSPDTTVLNAPWTAYLETFIAVDTGTTFIAATNLDSGKTRRCFLTTIAALRYSSTVHRIVVTRNGIVAWSREGHASRGLGDPGRGANREIGMCDGEEEGATIDAGNDIDLASLRQQRDRAAGSAAGDGDLQRQEDEGGAAGG